ncbi:GNAT family N-acetyltransferase [Streptosporangium subroseum]|uniref:GNAT family N-acetyltransferase n=1 Tax=Streptosporangium subroseum TaxID=106412 RepID=UPI00308768FA|nr:GNAT family N-acetyltransferase [Streptosporangium subroseum]
MWEFEIIKGHELDVEEVTALYHASGLAERRPVEDRSRFAEMLKESNLVVVARTGKRLIGISRCLTDGAYVTYLCDLAVDRESQRQGIGRDLVRETRAAAGRAKIVLLSAPAAAEYYPHIGFVRHDSAWVLDPAG